MKIYFIINALNSGGAERVIANLASEFSRNKHQVSIITFFKANDEYLIDEKIRHDVLEEGKKYKNRFTRFFQYGKIVLALRRKLKKERPDIAISFTTIPNFGLLLAALHISIKTIISVRNMPEYEYGQHFTHALLAKFLFKKAHGCVFQTQYAKQWFPMSIQKKSAIIYNPVNDIFYKTKHDPVNWNIVTCGRLMKQKNHNMLIASFYEVVQKLPNAQLYIYGSGELKETLELQIQDLNLHNNVFLMGRVNDVAAVLKDAEIFVLSSDFEGMPNALMEAMAVGVPCISTDCPCGGPKILLEDGKNGMLVPVGETKSMAQAIITLLENKELQENYSKSSKAIAAQFTQEKIYEEWLAYITKVIERG